MRQRPFCLEQAKHAWQTLAVTMLGITSVPYQIVLQTLGYAWLLHTPTLLRVVAITTKKQWSGNDTIQQDTIHETLLIVISNTDMRETSTAQQEKVPLINNTTI